VVITTSEAKDHLEDASLTENPIVTIEHPTKHRQQLVRINFWTASGGTV
jgi:hypothetical protein